MEKYFEIGKITGTHGIKGTLKIFPITSEPSRFSVLKKLIIDLNGNKLTFSVSKVAYHKQFVLVTVKEISDINEAEKFKGGTILVTENDAIPLEDDEYYTRDLYGIKVYTDEGEFLGEISDIYETGANDVYAVKNEKNEKELLIPAIKQCILNIDIKNKTMKVKLLEGLRD